MKHQLHEIWKEKDGWKVQAPKGILTFDRKGAAELFVKSMELINKKQPTSKLSELIERLQEYKRIYGDIPVVMAVDPEGNSYGTITQDSFDTDKSFLILYPNVDQLQKDEIEGFKE